MMSLSVSIGEYHEDDIDEIKGLFSTHFSSESHQLQDRYVNWLYRDNPAGRAQLVSGRVDGELAGFIALIPTYIARDGEMLKAFYAVNVLVGSRHAGKSIFLRMIDPTMDYVESLDAALIGHPNEMAIRMWQRKKMHFQETLQPYLAISKPISELKSRRISHLQELESLANLVASITQTKVSWKVRYDVKDLLWRFINHPINKYDIYALSRKNEFRGLQVTRKMKFGARLLIDQFVADEDMAAAVGKLPLPTICFASPNSQAVVRGALALSLRKTIPFFVTRKSNGIEPDQTRELGLSATDF